MIEVWKQIPGYKHRYAVSSLGRVRSLRRRVTRGPGISGFIQERILKQSLDKDGYRRVSLSRGPPRTIRTFTVHILMLLAFKGPRPKGFHGCHRDTDQSNNRLSNLRYATVADNSKDSKQKGKHAHGIKHGCAKLTEKDVLEIRLRFASGEKKNPLGRDYNVHAKQITHIVTRAQWAHI